MTYTENYHLKKPDGEDFIDIEDLNQNMEAIDAQLKAQAQKAEGDGTKVQEVQAALGQKADLKNGKVPAEQLPEMDYIASADRGAPGGEMGVAELQQTDHHPSLSPVRATRECPPRGDDSRPTNP